MNESYSEAAAYQRDTERPKTLGISGLEVPPPGKHLFLVCIINAEGELMRVTCEVSASMVVTGTDFQYRILSPALHQLAHGLSRRAAAQGVA